MGDNGASSGKSGGASNKQNANQTTLISVEYDSESQLRDQIAFANKSSGASNELH